jgi:hypothetical protein
LHYVSLGRIWCHGFDSSSHKLITDLCGDCLGSSLSSRDDEYRAGRTERKRKLRDAGSLASLKAPFDYLKT